MPCTDCNFCNRPPTEVVCNSCGHLMTGRVRQNCPAHSLTIQLMDHIQCPKCFSTRLQEFQRVKPQPSPTPSPSKLNSPVRNKSATNFSPAKATVKPRIPPFRLSSIQPETPTYSPPQLTSPFNNSTSKEASKENYYNSYQQSWQADQEAEVWD